MPESLLQLARSDVRPILIGALINSIMSGILLVQITVYFARYKGDSIWLKCLVIFSGVVSHSSTALAAVCAYIRVVLQFGSVDDWLKCIPEMTALMVLPKIQSTTVQLYFSWRASRYIGNPSVLVAVIMSASLQTVCAIISVLVDIFWPSLERSKINPSCLIWNTLVSATDIFVSTVLIYYLMKRRRGHPDSDNLLSKVARLTFQSGAITSGWATASVILFVAIRDPLSILLIMAQPPLYGNVLLAALNCRLYPRTPVREPENISTSTPDPQLGREKSPLPVSEVTLMSLGLEISSERGTVDMESSFGMTDIIEMNIRPHHERG